MSGKPKEGIDYYPVEADHIYHRKVRLLINEFDSDGYWIWSCLLGKVYKEKGYYLDVSDRDDLELFASDVCKKKVSLVEEVINGCIRRDLFNKVVFDMFDILTSDRIQFNYLHATSDRRKKGTTITLIEEIMLIEEDEDWKNVQILGIKDILPGKNAKVHGNLAQSKVKYSKRKKSKDCADAPPTAHWELLVKEWFDFNQLKFKQKPSFAGADPRYLKRIVELLEKRAHDSAVPWSAENAVSRLRGFLSKAYKDAFLSKNFLLYQLERNFDKITLNHAENGTRTDRQNNNKPVPETLGDGSFGKL